MKLKGKTALITGGNSGIGLATARLFAQEGARVAITGRNRDTLKSATAQIGSGCMPVEVDLQNIGAMEESVARVAREFGQLDILVANAAHHLPTPLGSTPIELFEAIVRTNITSVFFLVQAAVVFMSRGASIILTGSTSQNIGVPGLTAYSASKAAIRSMTRCFASELAPRGIRVNTLTPGAIRTPIWGTVAKEADFPELERVLNRSIPLGRVGESDEVAKAMLFLASDDSSNMLAAEIVVDGGQSGAPAGAPIYRPEAH
jgi:NAD(P)-dependent dehydrogenase (short-subunit alcohol dehydrogenase family)